MVLVGCDGWRDEKSGGGLCCVELFRFVFFYPVMETVFVAVKILPLRSLRQFFGTSPSPFMERVGR